MNQVKRPIIGVALMLGAMAVLPGIDVIAKLLGQQGMPILQVVWARLALGALMTLPFALRMVLPPLTPLRLSLLRPLFRQHPARGHHRQQPHPPAQRPQLHSRERNCRGRP